MSSNVKVYGAIYSAESCSYDPVRGVIVVPNRGVGQNVQTNNALDLVHQPRRLGAHRALDRRAESRRPAHQHDAAARAQRAARQRHRQRHALPGRPRRRHQPDRSGRLGDPPVQHADRRAGRRDPRREIDRLQRHRGRRRRHDLRDADRRRRPEPGSDDVAGVEDHAGRQRVDLRPGRAAAAAQRHRLRSAGQHRRRQHRQRRGADVLDRRQAAPDRERGAGGQRRPGDHAGRHQVREQRACRAASRASARASRPS